MQCVALHCLYIFPYNVSSQRSLGWVLYVCHQGIKKPLKVSESLRGLKVWQVLLPERVILGQQPNRGAAELRPWTGWYWL